MSNAGLPGPPGFMNRTPRRLAGSVALRRDTCSEIISPAGLPGSSGTRSCAHSTTASHLVNSTDEGGIGAPATGAPKSIGLGAGGPASVPRDFGELAALVDVEFFTDFFTTVVTAGRFTAGAFATDFFMVGWPVEGVRARAATRDGAPRAGTRRDNVMTSPRTQRILMKPRSRSPVAGRHHESGNRVGETTDRPRCLPRREVPDCSPRSPPNLTLETLRDDDRSIIAVTR